MIAVVYNGLDRFRKETYENHQWFFSELRKEFKIKIYDLTSEFIGRENCPYTKFEQTGNIQVWDFAQSLDRTKGEVILKIRTDLWITRSGLDTIISELRKVMKNEIDASFLGHIFKHHFSKKYCVEQTNNQQNVRDLVVIANKSKIRSSSLILEKIAENPAVRSGNLVYPHILPDSTKANNVYCQLYLVRKEYSVVDPYRICLDFVLQWNRKKSKDALDWITTMQHRYDEI